MKRLILLAMVIAVAASCRKEPSSSDFDGEYLVYTAHSEEVGDFSKFSTFTVADSLLYIDRTKGSLILNDWGKTVRSQYIKAMESYGYTYVDTGKDDSDQSVTIPEDVKADLGIQISYVVSTEYFTTYVPTDSYWWNGYPGYWYPGYWGNWGSWYYSFPVTYSYSTHSLLTEMVDMTGPEGDDQVLPVVWNSFIDGHIGNTRNDMSRFSRAIDQSFEQSKYLDKKN